MNFDGFSNYFMPLERNKTKMIREKNLWILLIFLLCGIVIGGLIANFASQVSWLSWLAYGE